jgi:two-component system, cell cycle sensor histidine kinase and response regulator CckA
VNNQGTILLVEDEDNLRELLKMILEEHGIKVLTAMDGEEALKIFTAHQDEIVLVLSDLGLPRLGGWEAFLKMKEIKPELKGILASGFSSADVRTEIIKSGAMEFISKPYDSDKIVATIRRALDERK